MRRQWEYLRLDLNAVPRRGNEMECSEVLAAMVGSLPPSAETALPFSSGRSASPQERFAVRRLSRLLGSRATRADASGERSAYPAPGEGTEGIAWPCTMRAQLR